MKSPGTSGFFLSLSEFLLFHKLGPAGDQSYGEREPDDPVCAEFCDGTSQKMDTSGRAFERR